jgi:hypothetical protein
MIEDRKEMRKSAFATLKGRAFALAVERSERGQNE